MLDVPAQRLDLHGERAAPSHLLDLEDSDIADLRMARGAAKRFRGALAKLRCEAGEVAAGSDAAPAEGAATPTLAALDFSSLIRQKLEDDFAGSRQWVTDKFTAWLSDDGGSPMFWLKGGAGTGKTVWSA